MITSLLYVSVSTLKLPGEAHEVDDLVAVARSRNATLDVTGALIFTEMHFAQILEGSAAAVEELMVSIRADRRHREVSTVSVIETPQRRFPDWSMAYSGPSFYLDRHVTPLLGAAPGRGINHLVETLRELIRECAVSKL